MKKIILPTDFSENARQSLDYAAKLFADEPVEFVIINTYDPPPTPAQLKSKKLAETIESDSLSDLENEKKFLASKLRNSNTRIECLNRKGALSTVLTNVGKRQKADLIVMSPRGEGQSTGGFGSNTIAVMKSSDIPVLVVPEEKAFHPYKKIIFAADLQGYSNETLEYPLDFFVREFDSTVEIIHFGTDESKEKNQIMGNLVEAFGDERTHVEYIQEDNVIEGLNKLVKNQQPDLLVLVNRHRWFFSKLFIKSVTKKMIIEAPVPLLILHDKA